MFSALLFLIFLLGIFALSSRLFKVDGAFVQVLSISLCIVILFIGAIANLLMLTYVALLILGFASFFYFAAKDRKAFRFVLTPGFCFFTAMSIAIAIAIYGKTPYQYDNYSHWALIMKTVYQTNALPTPDSLVTFVNYPPATALWGYFVMKCICFGEDIMVFAQGMLVASALCSLFAGIRFCDYGKLVTALSAALAMAFVVEVNLINLYVDALLGYLAAAGVCLLYHQIKDSVYNLKCVALLLSALILAKPSAVLMVCFVVAFGLLFVLRFGENGNKGAKIRGLLFWTAVVPAVFSAAFSIRTHLVYDNKVTLPFDISVEGIYSGLESKSADFFSTFIPKFIAALFDLNLFPNLVGLIMFVVIALFVLIKLISSKKMPNISHLILATGCLAAYIIGVFVMYCTLMPQGESLILASFSRYMGTGVVFFIGCVMLFLINDEPVRLPWRSFSYLISCIPLLLCCYFGASYIPDDIDYIRNSTQARREISLAAEQVKDLIPESDMVVWCVDDRAEEGYYYYVIRYFFMRRYVWAMSHEKITEDVWGPEKDDCLILLVRPNEEILNYLYSTFGEAEYKAGLYEKDGGSLNLLREIDVR